MFTPATFQFLRDLSANNTRDWFEANRPRWEAHGKGPLLAFIADFRPKLQAIAPQFDATARSVFRIHRDVRFSKDKSPYKTHLAAQFRHQDVHGAAGDVVHAPAFYLHIAPDAHAESQSESPSETDGASESQIGMRGVFGGFGMWQPEPAVLRTLRKGMVDDPDAWRKACEGLKLTGSSLKRPPPGFDPAHPLADDLRRKDFITLTPFTEADVVRTDFPERYAEACRAAAPLQAWLCAAVGLPFGR